MASSLRRRALRSTAQGAVLRACLAGALCGVATAGVSIAAQPLLGADPDTAGWEQMARYWVVAGGVTVVASVLEIAFVYWDSLRSVHLPPAEQRMALQIVTVAAIIDGRFTAAERRLLRDAQLACGRAPDARAAERLRRAFVAGDASLDALLRAFG